MVRKLPILVCPPDHFGVEYVINPWMEGHVGQARQTVAEQQWWKLYKLLDELAGVERMEPGEHLPDMCFAANAGLVYGDTFVPSVFRVPQRAGEVPLFERWFEDHGFDVVHLPEDEFFEGEGDALFWPGERVLWAGYGVRSSLESHRSLCEIFNVEVISLRLVDERFYHLDTCFVPLPGGRVMYYPAAFDELSLKTIRDRVPAERRLAVSEADAMRFACNAVRIGHDIVCNDASDDLRDRLEGWGFRVHATPLDEFMLAGGAAKCLVLLLEQEVPSETEAAGEGRRPEKVVSPIRDMEVELRGHLLDSGLMNRSLDVVTERGGSFRLTTFRAGERRDQDSLARIRVSAPTAERLETIVNQLMAMGAKPVAEEHLDARLETVQQDGVAPDDFFSTTIYPTDVRVNGQWVRVAKQRMDAVIVVDEKATGDGASATARCDLIRNLKRGEKVVCGVAGVRMRHMPAEKRDGGFAFMSAEVSSERRVELVVEELAWEMRRIRSRGGKIVFVSGPVAIHTGGGRHLQRLIRAGYMQVLLAGNALPVHDIELNLLGTSLGVDLKRGVGVHGGHHHHLRAINAVRKAGSIRKAVEQGVITDGVMYECVKNNVEYVLAGSIRDDGPLPDTLMDLVEAQQRYAEAIEGAEMIIMLSTMLHAIGVGNMTPAGVKLVCVDISPAVVTKLADRGSVESVGVVTDVGLFLHLLAARLCGEDGGTPRISVAAEVARER